MFTFFTLVFVLSIKNLQATTEYDTFLHIFTKNNVQTPITVQWKNTKIWSKEKSLEKCQIKLIAHGYAERWNMDWRWDWVEEMKNEILSDRMKEKYCVIAIDWEKGAREANFITAVANADISGQHLAEFLLNNHIDPKRLHCIGFSLGAHLCAFASNNYYFLSNKTAKFKRISGLDPAGPLLRKASVDKRLSPDDAEFVDCIHSSTTFGLQEKSGHMDFFPDGGKSSARGCEKIIRVQDEDVRRRKRFFFGQTKEENEDSPRKNLLEKLRDGIGKISPLKKIFLNVHAFIGCNHLRSPHYFISSINQCEFRAKLCSSWSDYLTKSCEDPIDNDLTYARMGFHSDQSDLIYQRGNGSFYLQTVSKAPYCSKSSKKREKTKKQIPSKSKGKKSKPK